MIHWERLKEPFSSIDIEWRIQKAEIKNSQPRARILAYVTNRAVQDRLDEVFSVAGWKNEFKEGPEGGVLCGISFYANDQWITKWDGADNTKIEEVKGGLSASMKRAAVQIGIGRYLYRLGKSYAWFSDTGQYQSKIGDTWFSWDPPTLPDWALPEDERGNQATQPEEPQRYTQSEILNISLADIPDESLGSYFGALKTYAGDVGVGQGRIEEIRNRAMVAYKEQKLGNLRSYIQDLYDIVSDALQPQEEELF